MDAHGKVATNVEPVTETGGREVAKSTATPGKSPGMTYGYQSRTQFDSMFVTPHADERAVIIA